MRHISRFFLVVLILVLSACGFRLRGTVQLPPGIASIHLAAPEGALRRDLSVSLGQAGIRLLPSATGADAVLAIDRLRQTRRILSVSGSGRVLEYQLRLQLDVTLTTVRGRVLLPRETLTMERDYRFDDNAVLGKTTEEGVLWQEMQRDMAQTILRRLSALRVRAR